jgi:hypothetical protein
MNFVIPFREFEPQFGRDHTTAAVGRIAGDTDFHVRPFCFLYGSLDLIDSMAMPPPGFSY